MFIQSIKKKKSMNLISIKINTKDIKKQYT